MIGINTSCKDLLDVLSNEGYVWDSWAAKVHEYVSHVWGKASAFQEGGLAQGV